MNGFRAGGHLLSVLRSKPQKTQTSRVVPQSALTCAGTIGTHSGGDTFKSLASTVSAGIEVVTARKTALVRRTSELHRAMQAEIGRQLRSEYEAPQELSTDLAIP